MATVKFSCPACGTYLGCPAPAPKVVRCPCGQDLATPNTSSHPLPAGPPPVRATFGFQHDPLEDLMYKVLLGGFAFGMLGLFVYLKIVPLFGR